MSFTKRIENFVCEKCNHRNVGNGFTNHCQKCLWSKHVDVDPGDRASSCRGIMEPIETGSKNHELRIKQRCQKCGFERWAPVLPTDDFEVVLEMQNRRAEELR